jgi:hypothetical protein
MYRTASGRSRCASAAQTDRLSRPGAAGGRQLQPPDGAADAVLRVHAGFGDGAHGREVHPARGLQHRATFRPAHGLARSARLKLSSMITSGAMTSGPRPVAPGCRPPPPPWSGGRRRPGRGGRHSPTPPQAATWLSLIRMASSRPKRWLTPPPQRTAYFSSARRPGVVLRVSTMRARGPSTADIGPGQGGDPREAAQQVQRRALGRQQGAGIALDAGQPRRRRRWSPSPTTVRTSLADPGQDRQPCAGQAGHDAIAGGPRRPPTAARRVDAGLGGDVAGPAEILGQGGLSTMGRPAGRARAG